MKAEGLGNIFHPGNFFAAAILNALKLALKFRSFQLFSKNFQILLILAKFEDFVRLTIIASESPIFIIFVWEIHQMKAEVFGNISYVALFSIQAL